MIMELNVRPFKDSDDCLAMIDYFLESSPEYLLKLGADPEKLPKRSEWLDLLMKDLGKPKEEKTFYYLLWELDGQGIGHTNINQIIYDQEAFMHLHLWESEKRQAGLGTSFLKKAIPIFFKEFKLQTLFCECNAHNLGPNRTLPKLGFEFIKQHEINPGWINYVQPINRWALDKTTFEKVY
ncbi:MAG: hypothetical protein Sapg2KO_06700 [Saprospiraceae bacterium]